MGKTIAQKIFEAHLVDKPFEGTNILKLDRVFCHEITTPIAINDLIERGKDRVFDPTKIKAVIDHVTPAKDSKCAMQEKILRDWAGRNNIKDFFDIGANGVCHAIFPEKGYVRPGYTVIMGILKGVCSFREPKALKFVLNGTLKPGVYAKDVILFLIGEIGVNGATNCVAEFTGPVVDKFSMEERMTICNMAVEAGATSGICFPDMTTVEYLWPFIKDEFASKEEALKEYSKWVDDEDATYEKVYTFDLSNLEPVCTINYKPDQIKKVSEMKGTKVDQVYIGSCTNGRLSDLRVAAQILKGHHLAAGVRGIVSPATPKIYKDAMDEGLLGIFMDAGFCVTNPTCGACLGMSNGVLAEGEVCASTTNRNFNGRMGKGGMVHLMSPATAAATAIAGTITNSELYKG